LPEAKILPVVNAAVGRPVSIVSERAEEVAVLPATVESVTLKLHVPSSKFPKVQLPETIVHVTSEEPALVAVTNAVPVKVPDTDIVGVSSFVTLSVDEDPRSEPEVKSGVDGVVILCELITRPLNATESAESTPPTVCLTLIEYVPFGSVENVHEPVDPDAVNVQVTGLPVEGVAVTVTDAPEVRPDKSRVGVLSAVELSVDDEPRSDPAARSGTEGTAIVVVRDTFDTAEIPPAESLTTT
jgi:hypothetical protein